MHEPIECPDCHREIARQYEEWLWKVSHCPFCLIPLMPVMDDVINESSNDLEAVFFFASAGRG